MPTWVLENGTGLSNATSLCSVEAADDHWSTHPEVGTRWDGLHSEEKEAKLMQASMLVARRLNWRGSPVTRDQAFPVPAAGLRDYIGRLHDSDEVPADVARGVAELAGLLDEAGVIDAAAPAVKSQATGPNSVTYAGGDANEGSIGGIPARVLQYLQPYIYTQRLMVRA